jgi:hypothetical protein
VAAQTARYDWSESKNTDNISKRSVEMDEEGIGPETEIMLISLSSLPLSERIPQAKPSRILTFGCEGRVARL